MALFAKKNPKAPSPKSTGEKASDHLRANWHPGKNYSILPWELEPLNSKQLELILHWGWAFITAVENNGILYYYFRNTGGNVI